MIMMNIEIKDNSYTICNMFIMKRLTLFYKAIYKFLHMQKSNQYITTT